MKKHILCNFSKMYKYIDKSNTYYDDLTQLSYKDKEFKKMVMNNFESTMLTENLENSDPDEFNINASTKLTFIVENSDEDELYANCGTLETRVMENSDPDEFVC